MSSAGVGSIGSLGARHDSSRSLINGAAGCAAVREWYAFAEERPDGGTKARRSWP
jgi:hypothetical protein